MASPIVTTLPTKDEEIESARPRGFTACILVIVYLPYAAPLWTPLRLTGDSIELLGIAASPADGRGFLDHGVKTHYPPGDPATVVVRERIGRRTLLGAGWAQRTVLDRGSFEHVLHLPEVSRMEQRLGLEGNRVLPSHEGFGAFLPYRLHEIGVLGLNAPSSKPSRLSAAVGLLSETNNRSRVHQSALEPRPRYGPSGTALIGVDATYTANSTERVRRDRNVEGHNGKC